MYDFLSSRDWLNFQKQIGRKAWEFDNGKVKANIIRHNMPFGKNYLYIPHGPEVNLNFIRGSLKHEIDGFINYLKSIAKENNSIFIKIEPTTDSILELIWQKEFKKSQKNLQPSKTVVLELFKTEEELFKSLNHGAQYSLSIAAKSNLEIIEIDPANFNEVWDLFKHTEKRDRFFLHEKSYYEELLNFKGQEFLTKIFAVQNNGSKLAVAIVGYYKDFVYYLHAASDMKFREHQGPRALLWHLIKKAKQEGYKYFDFWGIDAKRMPGVTKFKLSFGGKVIERPGSFDLPISGFWYFLYRIYQSIK